MKVRFIRDTLPGETAGPGHKKGDVVEVSEASAARWLRRKAIEQLTHDAKLEAKAEEKKVEAPTGKKAEASVPAPKPGLKAAKSKK